MAIKHILLDMDGVLADFQRAALKLFGYYIGGRKPDGVQLVPHDAGDSSLLYPYKEWSIAKVLGVSNTKFWKEIHKHRGFFSSLPAAYDAVSLVKMIEGSGIPFTISTSPSMDEECASAKVRWLRTFLRNQRFHDYMVGKQKWLMANPNHLLIDDSPRNCQEFVNKGGQCYLWPQFWNEAHPYEDDRLEHLQTVLSKC